MSDNPDDITIDISVFEQCYDALNDALEVFRAAGDEPSVQWTLSTLEYLDHQRRRYLIGEEGQATSHLVH